MKRTVRFYFALVVSKMVKNLLKLLNREASYLPGKIAIKICPDFLGMIAKPKIIIGVTGTNGKTTVSNLITDCLEKCGYTVLNNRFGSNINAGIASSLIKNVTISQKVKADIAVLEIDERSSPKIYPYLKPTYLVCNNLLRDSIKRNAHPEFIFNVINNALPEETKLILNADDLISSALGKNNAKVYFGVGKQEGDLKESRNIINDIRICPNCQTKLEYNYVKYNHIGNAYCPNCDFKSKEADYLVTNIDYEKEILTVKHTEIETEYKLLNNSIFNIYNMAAVITLLREFGLSAEKVQELFKDLKITETRYTKEEINGVKLISNMTKGQNSIATSCVFDYISKEPGKKEVVLILDDAYDAKDSVENLTWIYDTDFEFLKDDNIEKIIVGGIRAKDYYIRLLLAGIDKDKIICEKEELDTYKYLSLDKDKTIYVLFELYKYDVAEKLKQRIRDAIKEAK